MGEILQRLSAAAGLREAETRRIMLHAPTRYKTYTIQRPSGRPRLISQPTAEVKRLQRLLGPILLDKFPVHPAATAYRPGMSTLDNAAPHAANGPILKMDFKDFFPSIRSRDWVSFCSGRHIIPDPEDVYLTSYLLFQRRKGERVMRLAIGAPSSPAVSNAMLFTFDSLVSKKVGEDQVVYTRYADDLTFSAARTGYMVRVIKDVSSIVRGLRYPKLDINHSKTTYVTKKFGRHVTGLTLTNDNRVTIGRERKRLVRACMHRFVHGELSNEEQQILTGMLAYINSVESTFLDQLRAKYGHDEVQAAQSGVRLGVQLAPHEPPLASK